MYLGGLSSRSVSRSSVCGLSCPIPLVFYPAESFLCNSSTTDVNFPKTAVCTSFVSIFPVGAFGISTLLCLARGPPGRGLFFRSSRVFCLFSVLHGRAARRLPTRLLSTTTDSSLSARLCWQYIWCIHRVQILQLSSPGVFKSGES